MNFFSNFFPSFSLFIIKNSRRTWLHRRSAWNCRAFSK